MKNLVMLSVVTMNLFANNISKGKELFGAYCSICHSVTGKQSLGPDLNLVSYSKHKEQIKKYIVDPSQYYEEFGYSANAMPKLPLTNEEVDFVVDYIDSIQPFKVWMKK